MRDNYGDSAGHDFPFGIPHSVPINKTDYVKIKITPPKWSYQKANARQELKVAQYEDILQKSDPLQILENYHFL